MAETNYLYIAVGFLGTLFIMKTFRALRPSSAQAMSSLNNKTNTLANIPINTGCSKCRGR